MKQNTSKSKKVFIYTSDTDLTMVTRDKLIDRLTGTGYTIIDEPDGADLYVCIGGDGTFLHCVQHCNFPAAPILGINTGHLGFFQELEPDDIDGFLTAFEEGKYQLQEIAPVEATIYAKGSVTKVIALNEILIRGPYTHITHLNVKIGNTTIQEFSGDGILFSTPVGSTAYNYALMGAIISPDLHAMQMTPVAPSNTNAYRCFPTSIIYKDDQIVSITPIRKTVSDSLLFSYDGISSVYDSVDHVEVTKSQKKISIIRFEKYDYWTKLTTKLL